MINKDYSCLLRRSISDMAEPKPEAEVRQVMGGKS